MPGSATPPPPGEIPLLAGTIPDTLWSYPTSSALQARLAGRVCAAGVVTLQTTCVGSGRSWDENMEGGWGWCETGREELRYEGPGVPGRAGFFHPEVPSVLRPAGPTAQVPPYVIRGRFSDDENSESKPDSTRTDDHQSVGYVFKKLTPLRGGSA